jgi:hypothetical protein
VPETPGDDGTSDLPEWFMPPTMIGGYVTGPVLVTRSGSLVVVARQVLAFPAGIEVEVEAHARGSLAVTDPVPADLFGRPTLQFHVRFADGREAVQNDETGLRSGRGPMLVITGSQNSYGGPDDPEDVRLTLWIWPLPPPGPVAVTCSWPNRGLHHAGFVLDGDAIQAAASQAQPFWPEPGS